MRHGGLLLPRVPLLLASALLLTLPATFPSLAADPGTLDAAGLADRVDEDVAPGGNQPCLLGAPDLARQDAVAAGPPDVLYGEGFSAGLAGWTAVNTQGRPNLWHWTTFAGNGSAHDSLLHGDAGRLYYGIENAFGGTYNTSRMRNQGELRSPAVALPAGGVYAIALHTKWHVEFDRPLIIDSMTLGYAVDGGARQTLCYLGNAWAPAWNVFMGYGYYQASPWGSAVFTGCEYALESPQNPCRLSEDALGVRTAFDLAPHLALWEPRSILLPPEAAGHDVQVTLHFQTGDAIVDDAMGWMVDDVRVLRVA